MFKRIIIVLMVVINLCGCSFLPGKEENTTDTKSIMLDHLFEKYGYIDYEVIRYEKKHDAGVFDEACPNDTLELEVLINDEKERIVVELRENDDGYECYDNYFGHLVRDEAENYIKEIVEMHFGKNKIYVIFGVNSFFPNNLTDKSNFDDLLASDKAGYTVDLTIYSDIGEQTIDEYENTINEFIKEYEKLGIITGISIYGCENQVFDDESGIEISEKNAKYSYYYTVNN